MINLWAYSLLIHLLFFTTIETRRDKTQIFFERRLSRFPNRTNLLTNEDFLHELFDQYRLDHPRRQRKLSNETQRYQSFQTTLNDIVEHENQPKRTFTVGLNKFSDWIPSELEILRGTKPPSFDVRSKFVTMSVSRGQNQVQTKKSQTILPSTFDYTSRVSALNNVSIIRPVRDQGQCGSCYAFAMITLVEAQYAFHFGQAVNMSDQQIVDCSTGDFGCVGGYFDTSFNYLKSNDWYVNSAISYPYRAVQSNCSATKTNGYAAGNLVYRHLPAGNATAMQEALINFGPLWISLYIGSDCSGSSSSSSCPVKPSAAKKIMNTFQSYTGGIFQANGCVTSEDNNNHAMVIVGFGYDAGTKLHYWKLRNSWGEDWGEDGYIRIRRGVNMCNIESDAFFLAKSVV